MYAQIEVPEITKLATLKASGLVTQTYMVLAAHDWGRGSCFPSMKTIFQKLGGAYHIKSIQRALKWLEDNQLIKRQQATSKERFTMVLRKVKEAVTKSFLKPQDGYHKNQMKRRNNNTYYSKSRKINKITKEDKLKKYHDEVYEAVMDKYDDRKVHLWFNNPENARFIKNTGLKAPQHPAPSTRPEKYSNEVVCKVIHRRLGGETKETRQNIINFYLSLTPTDE